MKKRLFLIIFMITCITHIKPTFAKSWDSFRNHEAILFTGQSIKQFISIPIDQIFIYSYREQDNSWHQITFQIDELDGNNGYFNKNYNAVVDAVDEFLFMAGDAGDFAPPSSWIDDDDSKQYIRHQFEITNPDDPLNKKYVYAYRSSVLTHNPNLPYYIKYIAPTSGASDTIKALAYLEGHNNKGIPDVWKIADSIGVYGPDILDRQKARAKGKYLNFISYDLDEDNLNVDKLQYKRGPIRIIRDITYKAKFSGIDVSVGTFRYRYYPYRIVALGADRSLDSDYGVKLLRQSFDLESTAVGMIFNNPNNFNVPIDGVQDSVNTEVQPSPVMNWYTCSGDPGTLVMLNEFIPPSSSSYQLYYQESPNGETADGTSDTGDKMSFGDVGIMFKGSKMKGSISLPYFAYFLPGAQHRDMGTTLAHQTQNRLTKFSTGQSFIPPTEVAISLPDTSGPGQYPIAIPVGVGNLAGLNILSFKLAIQFDPQALQATGVSTENTLVENWDPPMVTIASDTLYITMGGTTALQDSGVLVYLNFNVIGTEGQQSPLHFIQAKFNTWNPLARTKDGVFTILPTPKVLVSLPNGYGRPNSDVLIPIRIEDVTEFNIKRCLIELQFNRYLLDATHVFTDGSISSGWSNITFNDLIGSITIEMSGEPPLTGSGTLVWIKFNVMDKLGLSTYVTFRNVVFNNGAPLAETKNGRLFVSDPITTEISVSIPDVTIKSLDTLQLPVTVSSIAGYELVGYSMDISFDPDILTFKSIDTTNTINSGWGYPLVHYNSGELSIDNYGDIPLKNDEVLTYLDFDVVGADGSSTTIHFSNMTFNLGAFPAKTQDGTIDVRGVVPVELSSFIATVINNKVKLDWTTTTESNNYGFYIHRHSNISSTWETIGFVRGKGTTTVPQSYSFIDSDVTSGTWSYRLQQQDVDGKIHHSEIIEVNLTIATKFALYQNYPNPFNSLTVIQYDLPTGENKVKLTIYDLLGHKIRTLMNKDDQTAGVYQITWDGRDDNGKAVATGVYFYKLHVGQKYLIKKMVLIE